jgi:hypothetical protein
MPAIIYQKTPGGLFATGERTVSTFPSGLVRVDQTFICSTPNVATHRADLKVGNDFPGSSEPAIDGLYIYPEVQENRRGDGFSELIASGYGRTTTDLQNIRKQIFTGIEIRTYFNGITLLGLNFYYSLNTINGFIVIKNGEQLSVDDLGLDDQLFIPYNLVPVNGDSSLIITSIDFNYESFNYIDWNGDLRIRRKNRINFYVSSIGPQTPFTFAYVSPIIKVINSVNYGEFTELEISVR